jgi:hypothetical protein
MCSSSARRWQYINKKFAQTLDKLYNYAYTHGNTGFPKSKLYDKLLNE